MTNTAATKAPVKMIRQMTKAASNPRTTPALETILMVLVDRRPGTTPSLMTTPVAPVASLTALAAIWEVETRREPGARGTTGVSLRWAPSPSRSSSSKRTPRFHTDSRWSSSRKANLSSTSRARCGLSVMFRIHSSFNWTLCCPTTTSLTTTTTRKGASRAVAMIQMMVRTVTAATARTVVRSTGAASDSVQGPAVSRTW
mmetsp:Transcript_88426/g.285639  ORF Transcript_88426/g.285639 Transcript_88426/m.285639 type:complete len:200 (-) Transcript_88426:575-1174(-)